MDPPASKTRKAPGTPTQAKSPPTKRHKRAAVRKSSRRPWASLESKGARIAATVPPGSFTPEDHFYPRVLNAQLHPMVASFMKLSHERICRRYCHLHPGVDEAVLEKYLKYIPKYFRWSGSDLLNVTDADGRRQMVVIETNSCPSGQKSMPHDDEQENAGYHNLMNDTFLPMMAEAKAQGRLVDGVLAVIFDKNKMEATGYAAQLATVANEPVYIAEFYTTDSNPPVRFEGGVLYIRGPTVALTRPDGWTPVRAAFRYVTQKPWNRIPLQTKTVILNPVVACLAGGRNKMVASKAYELFNADLEGQASGLVIRFPETINDVSKTEVPLWVKSFGGHAVVKVPYSNAGQGVYTITSPDELKAFMESNEAYDKYIVQSLIGNSGWSSVTRAGQLYHVGTIPNKDLQTHVADLRVMINYVEGVGLKPLVVYARRARKPLVEELAPEDAKRSWSMLGTNLSVKKPDGSWDTETNRLMLMDRRDFNRLGIGLDDLIDAFVQTVLASVSIDKMAIRLLPEGKAFNKGLFSSLCYDPMLLNEIL